jgi:hypothetical protein
MGSSGGGGSSGAVSHSPYLETVHGDWLNSAGADTISSSITDVMSSAIGSSPWIGKVAYDPSVPIAAYETEMAALKLLLAGLSDTVDWAALYAQAELTLVGPGEVALIAEVAAYENILADNLTAEVLPRFRRGMQDINAVQSSAFVLGEAVIEAFKDRDVAKYLSTLRLTMGDKKIAATEQMLQMMARRIGWNGEFVKYAIESNRIKIVALKEELDQNDVIDEHDAKWDLEVFQSGSNVMAASAGGTSTAGVKGISKTQSAIGGAMMGGAMGGMIAGAQAGGMAGNPYTVVAGAVLGAAAGMLSSN